MSTILKSAKQVLPTMDRVLVQRAKLAQQTASGIYIPEKNQTKQSIAQVIAVGPGFRTAEGKLIVPEVKAGDHVMIPQHGGHPVVIEKEEFLLFREGDLLAKVSEI